MSRSKRARPEAEPAKRRAVTAETQAAKQRDMVMALVEGGFASHPMSSADASSGYAKTPTLSVPKLKAAA